MSGVTQSIHIKEDSSVEVHQEDALLLLLLVARLLVYVQILQDQREFQHLSVELLVSNLLDQKDYQ